MSTTIRSQVSKGNPYYIPKHRYYELKHFCLQYKEFKRIYNDICDSTNGGIIVLKDSHTDDDRLEVRQRYLDAISLIEESAKLTDAQLWLYILRGVTEELSYSYFRAMYNIPCCKDTYYDLYRKFFYILSKKKGII